MDKIIEYTPQGTCSKKMRLVIDTDTNRILDFDVIGGCNGNLKGIKALIIGMKAEEVKERLAGIKCGYKNTSCPDQLAKALSIYLERKTNDAQ